MPFDDEVLIEKIFSGGFSDPHNPPSLMDFYRINDLFHSTYKTIDPCDFIWDTPEKYALAQLYSMSGRVFCKAMHLEQAAFYMGYLISCGLIDRNVVERELFESGFGLCVEEIFDQRDILDMEDEIAATRRIIDRNMQLGFSVARRKQYELFRILKPRQPNPHIDEVLNL